MGNTESSAGKTEDDVEAQNTPSSSFSSSISSSLSSLSPTSLPSSQRLIAFVVCLCLGILFCLMSTWLLIKPRVFAKLYTVGSLMIISSTFFLVSPMKQVQNLYSSGRLVSFGIYFSSIILTLIFALKYQRTGPTLLLVIVQFCAAVWYGASYVPFGQTIVSQAFFKLWR